MFSLLKTESYISLQQGQKKFFELLFCECLFMCFIAFKTISPQSLFGKAVVSHTQGIVASLFQHLDHDCLPGDRTGSTCLGQPCSTSTQCLEMSPQMASATKVKLPNVSKSHEIPDSLCPGKGDWVDEDPWENSTPWGSIGASPTWLLLSPRLTGCFMYSGESRGLGGWHVLLFHSHVPNTRCKDTQFTLTI
jgi:hypothetical protein